MPWDDSDVYVREEAAVGLGKRQDVRLLPKLTTMLDLPVLKERVAEAASALLGLREDPPDWGAEDYRRALEESFGSADRPYMTSNACEVWLSVSSPLPRNGTFFRCDCR